MCNRKNSEYCHLQLLSWIFLGLLFVEISILQSKRAERLTSREKAGATTTSCVNLCSALSYICYLLYNACTSWRARAPDRRWASPSTAALCNPVIPWILFGDQIRRTHPWIRFQYDTSLVNITRICRLSHVSFWYGTTGSAHMFLTIPLRPAKDIGNGCRTLLHIIKYWD